MCLERCQATSAALQHGFVVKNTFIELPNLDTRTWSIRRQRSDSHLLKAQAQTEAPLNRVCRERRSHIDEFLFIGFAVNAIPRFTVHGICSDLNFGRCRLF